MRQWCGHRRPGWRRHEHDVRVYGRDLVALFGRWLSHSLTMSSIEVDGHALDVQRSTSFDVHLGTGLNLDLFGIERQLAGLGADSDRIAYGVNLDAVIAAL